MNDGGAAADASGTPPAEGGEGWVHPGPFVFVVTVFGRLESRLVAIQSGPRRGEVREVAARDHRTWGWFASADGAEAALRINDGDMHETLYDLAVVERVGEGSMAVAEGETWWAFHAAANGGRGGYVPGARPADLDGVMNFGIG